MKKTLLLSLLLAACQGGAADPAPSDVAPDAPPEAPAATAPAAQPAAPVAETGGGISAEDLARAPSDAPLVEVTDPGKAPLKELRLTPAVGDVSRLRFSVGFEVDMAMGGAPMPAPKMPTMDMVTTLTVTGVEGGQITYETELVAVEVGQDDAKFPGMQAELQAAMAPLIGLRGVGVMTDRGRVLSMDLTPPEGGGAQLNDQLKTLERTFRNISKPLPEEPVGVGGTWTTLSRARQDLISLVQRTTTELVAIDGDQISTRTSLVQAWDGGEIDVSQMPPGSNAEVLKFSGVGEGTETIALGSLGLFQAGLFVDVELLLKLSNGALPAAEMHQRIQTNTQISRE